MRKGGIIMTPNKISGEKGNLQWLEIIKAIGPFLIVGTIIIGIWRFKVERERAGSRIPLFEYYKRARHRQQLGPCGCGHNDGNVSEET